MKSLLRALAHLIVWPVHFVCMMTFSAAGKLITPAIAPWVIGFGVFHLWPDLRPVVNTYSFVAAAFIMVIGCPAYYFARSSLEGISAFKAPWKVVVWRYICSFWGFFVYHAFLASWHSGWAVFLTICLVFTYLWLSSLPGIHRQWQALGARGE